MPEITTGQDRCPYCELVFEHVYANDTDWYGVLIYGYCEYCETEFVQDGDGDWVEAA